MAEKKQTYKDAIKKLEKLVSQIDSDELDIDQLSDTLKEVQGLIKFCQDKLYGVDEDIKKVFEQGDKDKRLE